MPSHRAHSCTSALPGAVLTCLTFWLRARWLTSNTAIGKISSAAQLVVSRAPFCSASEVLWGIFCRSHSLAGATGSFVHRSPAVSVDHRHPCAAPLVANRHNPHELPMHWICLKPA